MMTPGVFSLSWEHDNTKREQNKVFALDNVTAYNAKLFVYFC